MTFKEKSSQIAHRLKERRRLMGFSFLKVATDSKISKGSLSKIENGVNANPTLKTLMSLAKALAMDIDDLVSDDKTK